MNPEDKRQTEAQQPGNLTKQIQSEAVHLVPLSPVKHHPAASLMVFRLFGTNKINPWLFVV